jgi:two-component system, NarL family, nitrate/nitrite response regulator NarL
MGAGGEVVRVVVADDHPVYREGMARAVRQHAELELVAECADGTEALAAIERLAPDVALLDVRMRGVDALEILAALASTGLDSRVLLLSVDATGTVVHEAVALGAAGYLSKEEDRERICDAIVAVAKGATVFSPQTHAALARDIRLRGAEATPALSAREQEILVLTADGVSAPEIGQRLHLSPATIKTHLGHIYAKLGVSNRAAAVAAAMRRRILR